MALQKYVKIGGSYYKGETLSVSSTPGDYVLNMTFAAAGAASALTVIPNEYGPNDTIAVEHIASNGSVIHTLATDIPNVGRNAAWKLDFPAIHKIANGDSIRLTYTNTATVAMTVFAVLERIH